MEYYDINRLLMSNLIFFCILGQGKGYNIAKIYKFHKPMKWIVWLRLLYAINEVTGKNEYHRDRLEKNR